MTDMELAGEIERYLAPDAIYYQWMPSMADMEQIIAALRQSALAQTEIKGHMRVKDELQGRIAELEKDWETDADYVRMAERIKELEKLLSEAMENLIWCGGSADFGWGGKAQIGYDKGPRATIAAIHEALKSRA